MFFAIDDGHGLPHNPFKALVSPRPIGWIATRSPQGQENLAPYSYFNAVSDEPPIVMFSSSGAKDSLSFAQASGCFVAHSVSHEMMQAMNQSSASYPRGQSEIDHNGLATISGTMVDAPVLIDAPSALECRVTQILQPLDLAGQKAESYVVFGQVVGVHINDAYLTDEGRFDSQKAALVARGGYMDYAIIDQMVTMQRPKSL